MSHTEQISRESHMAQISVQRNKIIQSNHPPHPISLCVCLCLPACLPACLSLPPSLSLSSMERKGKCNRTDLPAASFPGAISLSLNFGQRNSAAVTDGPPPHPLLPLLPSLPPWGLSVSVAKSIHRHAVVSLEWNNLPQSNYPYPTAPV